MSNASFKRPSRARLYGALILVQVLFGVNYVISKAIIEVFHPLQWASLRLLLATPCLWAVAYLSGRKAPKIDREFLKKILIFSFLGIALNQGAFLYGLRYTTPTNSAVLNTLTPIFTLLLVTLTGIERFTLGRGVGFLFAFAGILTLRGIENFQISDETLFGDGLTLLNCLSFSIYLILSKPFLQKNDPFWVTAWMFTFGSLWITGITLPALGQMTRPELTPPLIAFCLFNIIGGTLLTYLLNTWALTYARSSLVALFIYLQPPVAALTAWILMGETVAPQKLVASAMVLAGLLLAIRFSAKTSETPSKDLSPQTSLAAGVNPKVRAKTPETS